MIQDGNLVLTWSVDDILSIGEDEEGNQRLSEDEAYDILESLDRWYDASVGINWDLIEQVVSQYLGKRGQ